MFLLLRVVSETESLFHLWLLKLRSLRRNPGTETAIQVPNNFSKSSHAIIDRIVVKDPNPDTDAAAPDVSGLLRALSQGDPQTFVAMIPVVYRERACQRPRWSMRPTFAWWNTS